MNSRAGQNSRQKLPPPWWEGRGGGNCGNGTLAAIVACCVAALALLGGCAQSDQSNGELAAAAATPAILVRVVDADEYRQTLARLRGKVVLVDFWATWCAPCVKQFPHTVSLERKFKDRGLAAISVSLDDPSEEQQVRDFLQKHDARFDNLLSKYGAGTESVDAFGLPGPVPCYRVYDRAGELRHEFAVDPSAKRQFTPEDIEAAVTALLSAESAEQMDRQGAKHAKEGSEPRRILPLRPLRSRGFIHSRQVWLAKVLLRRQSLRQKSRARPGRLNSHLDVGRLGAPGSMIVRARTSLQKMVKWAAVK